MNKISLVEYLLIYFLLFWIILGTGASIQESSIVKIESDKKESIELRVNSESILDHLILQIDSSFN